MQEGHVPIQLTLYDLLDNADCKLKNGMLHMQHAGLGHGEPTEQAWAVLGGLGRRIMMLSKAGRAVALEWHIEAFNKAKRSKLPQLLATMMKTASVKLAEADSELLHVKQMVENLQMQDVVDMDAMVSMLRIPLYLCQDLWLAVPCTRSACAYLILVHATH